MKMRILELNHPKRFEARSRMLDKLRTKFRNSNILKRGSLRRKEKRAQNEGMFMMLQLLKSVTDEYEKINTDIYHRILHNMGSGGSNQGL